MKIQFPATLAGLSVLATPLLIAPVFIFGRCLDSNPESGCRKQTRYQLSHQSSYQLSHPSPYQLSHTPPYQLSHPSPYQLSHPSPWISHPSPYQLSHPSPYQLSHPSPYQLCHPSPAIFTRYMFVCRAAHPCCTTLCWSAGTRIRWSVPPSRPSSGSWRTSSPCPTQTTRRPQPTDISPRLRGTYLSTFTNRQCFVRVQFTLN